MNRHDAEEAMRPYLARLLDAEDGLMERADIPAYCRALKAALDKALELLEVQR